MDLKFEWKKHPLNPSLILATRISPANVGKIALCAVVPTFCFEVHCVVTPNVDGETYDWTVHPQVRNSRHAISWMGTWFSMKGAFHEAAVGVANVEEFLRNEVSRCFSSRGSAIFDLWRYELASFLDTKKGP